MKLGPEEITQISPMSARGYRWKDLDENGIIRVGAGGHLRRLPRRQVTPKGRDGADG